jgi:hypothetical protein
MRFTLVSDSDVKEQFGKQHIASEMNEIRGQTRYIDPKETGIVQGTNDVLQIHYPAAAGYGDPIERELELVVEDVNEGYVTPQGALHDYFVVVRDDGDGGWTVDADATEACRSAEFARRRASGTDAVIDAAAHPTSGNGTVQLADVVRIEIDQGEAVFRCQACDHELGRDLASYKAGTKIDQLELIDAIPGFVPNDSTAAAELVLREHFCPGCFRRLDAEVVRRGDASLVDVEIWTPPAERP